LINVDDRGKNCIVVAPGSHGTLSEKDIIPDHFKTTTAVLFLLQLEIPLKTVEFAAKIAHEKDHEVILNPAPACLLTDELLACLYLITPNETEAERLTGIKVHDIASTENAAKMLLAKGVKNVWKPEN